MTVVEEPSAEALDKVLLRDTLVVVLLDASGSMASMKDAALESLNGLIHNQKMKPDGLRFSLMFFNQLETKFVHQTVPIEKVARITPEQFIPNTGTPLLDATASAMNHADEMKNPGEQVMIVIITDGYENCSKEWNKETLFSWIQNKQDEGWEFIYLGANQDAWDVAQSMGMRGSTYTYDSGSMAMASADVSSSLTAYRSGNYTPTNVDFTEDDEETKTGWPTGTPRPLP